MRTRLRKKKNITTTVYHTPTGNDGLFCAYAYPAPYPEGTRSTRIS